MLRTVSLPNLANSIFPIKADWDFEAKSWHKHYPSDVPPGLLYTPSRAEQLLLKAHDRFPDRAVLHYFRTSMTYRQLLSQVKTVAGNLRRLGIQAGDRVMLVLPNCPEYVVTWFALHWLGAQVVQVNPLLSPPDLSRLIRKSKARAVLGLDLRLAPIVESLKINRGPFLVVTSLAPHLPTWMRLPYRAKAWTLKNKPVRADRIVMHGFSELLDPRTEPVAEPALTDAALPAVLQPTGGTTGSPKIAVLSHASLHANVAQLHVWSGCAPGQETVLGVLPFFHVFGSTVVLLSAIAGGSTVLLQARFDPKRVLNLMCRYRPTIAPMVPFMFAALCEEMEKQNRVPEGLRTCFSGAAALRPELKTEFEQRTGATIFEGYGLSEASPVTHANPSNGNGRAGAIGIPLPNTIARIVDPHHDTKILPAGEVGELVIRGPQLMSGYLDNPEATQQTLRDGWLYTGDLACMDEDGYFKIVDRKKDMIISGGLNVYPAEVEAVLRLHPGVEDCAVVGVPDNRYGERVTAYIIPADGTSIDEQQLKAFCRSQMAGYKIPKTMELRSELPRTFLGKLRRVELRNDAA